NASGAHYLDILSEFSEEEKTTLLKVFAEFSSGNSYIQTAKTEVMATSIKNCFPTTIGESLKNGFVTYLQSMSSFHSSTSIVITEPGFISSIHKLVKTMPIDRSQAIHLIGQLSQGTLKDFVREVVRAALPYWFEGCYPPKQKQSTKESNKLFKEDMYLIDLIILRPKIKSKEKEDDELLTKIIKEAEIEGYFDQDGYIFGGFAYEDWKQNSKFSGDKKNFLFSIRPKLRCYPTTGYNNNFQYLNFGAKTLPNGGLWIDSDFIHGHSKAAPLSSTYGNPRLSKQEYFLIDEVEVRPTKIDLDEIPKGLKRSVLDNHPEELDLLEMATGRKMYSKDVREPDEFPEEE
ncbi:5458_t:CDS:2, partial [Racocetra fulgida]